MSIGATASRSRRAPATPTTQPALVDERQRPIRLVASATAAGAADLLHDVIRSGRLAAGPRVEAFEDACATMAGTRHALAVVNGTVSLELILEALGIGPGDEVITTSFTFAATVAAIVRRGATARLVDIGADGTIDPDAVEAAIGPRTAAVLPVHLYGQPADLVRLGRLCARHDLALIEDAAQAHGAAVHGRPVGSWGHGSFSFYATKNVSCGEGGAITTNDDAVAERIRLLRNQGMSARHHHEIVGGNARLSELHAALGLASFAHFDRHQARRCRNAAILWAGLEDLDERDLLLPRRTSGHGHAWHQFVVRSLRRDRLARRLDEAGIETGIHYPKPVHHQPAFADHPLVVADECRRASALARTCLALPVHHDLEDDDAIRVVDAVRDAFRRTP